MPTARATRQSEPDARPARWSSSAVLPMPGSPRTTRARLSPARTASSSRPSASRSPSRSVRSAGACAITLAKRNLPGKNREARSAYEAVIAADGRSAVRVRSPVPRSAGECRAQVVPEVVDVFAADAEAQEPRGHVALSGELAAPLDGAFDAAQAGGVDDDAQVVAEPVGGEGVGDLEGQDAAEAGHLRGGDAVSGVAG